MKPLARCYLAFFVVLALSLAGCSKRSEPEPSEEKAAPAAPSIASDAAANPNQVATAPDTERLSSGERLVIRTAQLLLRAENPERTAEQATRIAEQSGGYVLSSELDSVGEDSRRLRLELRIPEQKLDRTLECLHELGDLVHQAVTGEDVTEEFVDVSARLSTARTLETRLLALTQTTGNLSDLIEVERELERVRADIEAKEGRLEYLEQRAQMATVSLTAESPEQPFLASTESLGSQFENAFVQSGRLGLALVRGLIILLGALLPFALVTLLLAWPARALWRRYAGP